MKGKVRLKCMILVCDFIQYFLVNPFAYPHSVICYVKY